MTSQDFFRACRKGNLEHASQLLRMIPEIDVNWKDKVKTALINASMSGRVSIVQFLLKQENIQVNELTKSAFIAACYNGQLRVCLELMKRPDVEVNIVDTALYWACHQGHASIVKLILYHPKIDIDEGDRKPIDAGHKNTEDIRQMIREAQKREEIGENENLEFFQIRELVLFAVSVDGNDLEFASDEFKKDEVIVQKAVSSRGTALQFVDEQFRSRLDIVHQAVENEPSSILYASEELKKDRNLATLCVRNQPNTLQFLDDSIQRDREIVLEAIKVDGTSLRYADEGLRKDRYIVLKSLQSSKGKAIRYAHSTLLEDREFLIDAAVEEPRSVSTILKFKGHNQTIKDDIFLEMLARNASVLEILWQEKRSVVGRNFILESVRRNPQVLEFAPGVYKNDVNFLVDACHVNAETMKYLDNFVKGQKGFIMRVVRRNGMCYEHVLAPDLLSDESIAIEAVRQNPKAIKFIRMERFDKNSYSKIMKISIDGFSNLTKKHLYEIIMDDDGNSNEIITICRGYLSDRISLCRQLGVFKEAIQSAYVKLHLLSKKSGGEQQLETKSEEDMKIISDIFELVLSKFFFFPFSKEWKDDSGCEKLLNMKNIYEADILQLRDSILEGKFEEMIKEVKENFFSLDFNVEEFQILKFDMGFSFDEGTKEMVTSRFEDLESMYRNSFNLFRERIGTSGGGQEEEEEGEEGQESYLGCKLGDQKTGFGIEFEWRIVSKSGKLMLPLSIKKMKNKIKKKKKKKRKLFTCLFCGEFSSGLRNGHGIEYFEDSGKEKYVGSFKDGLKEGNGVEFYPNGKKSFKGSYRDGKRSGLGKEYYRQGKVKFRGNFSDGVRSGNGMEFSKKKDKMKDVFPLFEGTYERGLRNGRGELYDAKNGIITRGIWSYGNLLETEEKTNFSLPMIRFSDIQKHLSIQQSVGQGGYGIAYRVSLEKILESCSSEEEDEHGRKRDEIIRSILSLSSSTSQTAKKKKKRLPKEVVVKIMTVDSKSGKDFLFCRVKRGISLCCRLKSEHIHQIYAFISGTREIGYISESCLTSVDKLIRGNKHSIKIRDDDEEEEGEGEGKEELVCDLDKMETKIRILEETCIGMKELHSNHAMHRDMKWSNVLLSNDGTVRITDFDTLKEDETDFRAFMKDMNQTSHVGTRGFISPEVFLGKEYTLKCDVFAFGLMMYSMIFMTNFPYESQYQCNCGKRMDVIMKSNALDYHVAHCNLRPLLSKEMEKVPEFLIDIMAQSWHKNPFYRPTFSDICYRFELEKKKSFVSVILHIFQSHSSSWICDQKMYILKPYQISDIKNWVEEKFEGSSVIEIRHSVLGKIESDEALEEVVRKEASLSSFSLSSSLSSSNLVEMNIELDKMEISIDEFDNNNNNQEAGLGSSMGRQSNNNNNKNMVSLEKYEEALERIRKLEKRNHKLEKQVLKIEMLEEGNERLRRQCSSLRKELKGLKN